MRLSADDIRHLHTGSSFIACAPDPDWGYEVADRVLAHMRDSGSAPELRAVDEFDDDALIVSMGFVNNGLPISDLRPVGDEFTALLPLMEEALGRPVDGIMPLAAGNVNALLPLLVGAQAGLPVADADPMGRIFPLVEQTVFTLAGLPVGPVAASGATGESALLRVDRPVRAERLLRALAGEYGGWAATATYPMNAATLARTGVIGSMSRLMRIGRILDSDLEVEQKHDALQRTEGARRLIRARVGDVAWLARPTLPGQDYQPAGVVLIDEAEGRIVQLEVHNELLMVMVDGSVRAAIPDIITLLNPVDGSVVTLEDLWTGNTVDIVVTPAADPWYTPEGLRLAGPTAFNLFERRAEGGGA